MKNTSKTSTTFFTQFIACALLTACGGGSGSQTPGITAMTQTTYLSSSTANGEPDSETDPEGEGSSIKSIYRDDNMLIQLQLGLVNLRAVELVPCSSVISAAARRVIDFVFPSAYAHSAHVPSGPAGVIDILKPDLLVWDLGKLSAKPGNYCGIKLEISNVAAAHNGHVQSDAEGGTDLDTDAEEEGVHMNGKGVLVSPCYYPDTADSPQTPADSEFPHSCIEAAYTGAAVSSTVLFGEQLVLNTDHRAAHLMLATAYDNWFNGLDMTILESDAGEQTKLAQNVLDSFYLYSAE